MESDKSMDDQNGDDQNPEINQEGDELPQEENQDANPDQVVEEDIDYYDGLTDFGDGVEGKQKILFEPLSFRRTPFLEALYAREDTNEFISALLKGEKATLIDLVKRDKSKDSPLFFI